MRKVERHAQVFAQPRNGRAHKRNLHVDDPLDGRHGDDEAQESECAVEQEERGNVPMEKNGKSMKIERGAAK